MTETPQQAATSHAAGPQAQPKPPQSAGVKIHRVCIGCNNMFEVTMENYEAKHCPACRKE